MTVWTGADGLPSDTILDGAQDARGYIWLASYDGLVRFDGKSFSTLGAASGGFSGKSPRVLAASGAARGDGSLWIGTNTSGLFRYKDGSFTRFGLEEGLPDLSVRAIAIDQSGRVYVGTARGVARFDDQGMGGKLSAIKGGVASECGIANFLLPLEGGDVIVGSNLPGLWMIRGEGLVPYLAGQGIEGFSFSAGYLAPSNELWLGTSSGRILRVARNEVVESIDLPELKGASINSFYGDQDGTLWIATDRGIVYRRSGSFNFFSEENGLPSNVVSALWRDREGSLWAGTERGGLVKFSPGKFINISKRDGLVNDSVNAVTEDASGGIWVATDSGLSWFPSGAPLSPKWKKGAEALLKTLKDVRVRQVRFDPEDGSLWFATYSDGGLLVLSTDGSIRSIAKKEGLPTNRVRFSARTRSGAVWIGTTAGPAVLENGSMRTYGVDSGLPNLFILSAREDSTGRIWLGTDGGGLAIFDKGAFRVFTTKDGLAGNVVFRVLEDSKSRFWISTSDGLTLCEEGKFLSADRGAGLSGESVYEVLRGPDDKLWIITSRKVIVVSADELALALHRNGMAMGLRSYDRLDGLAGQLSANAWACMSAKGVVYLPTLQGLSFYNPQSVPLNKMPPPVLVERVEVDDRTWLESGERLDVPASAKRITFSYTALSYVVPQRVRFQYRLEGYDAAWTSSGTKREISYTNLPPGDYRFKVRAENNDGVVNEEGATVGIHRLPYFWQTLPFYLILAAAVSGAVWLAFKLRLRRLEQRGRELNRLVEERTNELAAERDKSEALLRNVLPESVANELKASGHARPRLYRETTVMFADLVGFTARSQSIPPEELIGELNEIFTAFDDILAARGCERIKTLGDGYLACCGVPEPVEDHARLLVESAVEIMRYLESRNASVKRPWELRIGIHSGPVVGGVVGVRKYIFDIFGDTVNTASRLEALSVPMSITISEVTASILGPRCGLVKRPPRPVKGKGEMTTYFVCWKPGDAERLAARA
jgi:ligand-binding sensor domain-containing protein/class 3 adenylate cyclase